MFDFLKKRRRTYRTREEWEYFLPSTAEERKKKLKALRNQRYYDKNRRGE